MRLLGRETRVKAVRLLKTHSTALGIVALCGFSALLVCRCGKLTGEELRVATWVRKNGIRIDGYQYGEPDDASFDFDKWSAEGRSIPNCEEIILRLLSRNDPHVEPILLIQALREVGSKRSVPWLKWYAWHEWSLLRHYAIAALGKVGDSEVFEVLFNRLFWDESSSCRVQAAQALVEIGDPRGIQALEDCIAKAKLCEEHETDDIWRDSCSFLRRIAEECLVRLREKVDGRK